MGLTANPKLKQCYQNKAGLCRGELCMAWRWFDPETAEVYDTTIKDLPIYKGKIQVVGRRGFCGVAGPIGSHEGRPKASVDLKDLPPEVKLI